MKIHNFFKDGVIALKNLAFQSLKSNIKSILSSVVKQTNPDKTTTFLLNGDFEFTDKTNNFPLLIFGKQNQEWKEYSKVVIKEPLGVLGKVCCDGENLDKQKILHFYVFKGVGKSKLDKLETSIAKLVPKMNFQIILETSTEEDFEEEEEEGSEIEDSQEEKIEDAAIAPLLINNLKTISTKFKAIKPNLKTDPSIEKENIIHLLDYIDEWQELYSHNPEVVIAHSLTTYKQPIQEIEDYLRKIALILNNPLLEQTRKTIQFLQKSEYLNDVVFLENLALLKTKDNLQDHIFKGEYTFNGQSIDPTGLHHHKEMLPFPPNNSTVYKSGDVMLDPSKIDPKTPLDDQAYSGHFQMFSIEAQTFQKGTKAIQKKLLNGTLKEYEVGWKSKKSTFFPLNWDENRVIEECALAFSRKTIKPMPNPITHQAAFDMRLLSPSKTCQGLCSTGLIIEFLITKQQRDKDNEQNTNAESLFGDETFDDVKTFYPLK